jgi:hypothetical protein
VEENGKRSASSVRRWALPFRLEDAAASRLNVLVKHSAPGRWLHQPTQGKRRALHLLQPRRAMSTATDYAQPERRAWLLRFNSAEQARLLSSRIRMAGWVFVLCFILLGATK